MTLSQPKRNNLNVSKNVTFVYTGIAGLFCECENAEVITDENPKYTRFGSWWDTSVGSGQSKVGKTGETEKIVR